MSDRVTSTELDVSVQRLYQEYLRALYVLFKSSFLYDTNNQTLVSSCERVANAANEIRTNVAAVASLELLADGAYVNRTLLKLDATTYEHADYLYTITSTLGVAAISALDDTTSDDWLELVAVFKRCVGPGGELSDFVKTQLPRIQLVAAVGGAGANNLVAMTNRFRALRAYATTVVAIGDVIDAARDGRALRALRIKRPLQEMISLSEEAGSLLLSLAHLKRHKLTLQHHLANTAVFAICAIRSLGIARAMRAALGLTAALHDLGRAFAIDDPTATGLVVERRHALHSVRKLVGSPLSSQQMLARAVAANEVRRWVDRDAEPPGDDPFPFELSAAAKIVAVAHAYSLLTTPRPDRPALLPDEALRLIIRDAGRRYDLAAVRLFVNVLGVYPVGSTVELSDGRIAIVTEAPHDAAGPAEPRVKIVRDAGGAIVDGELVDLAGGAGGIGVVRCVDGEDHEINAPAFLLS